MDLKVVWKDAMLFEGVTDSHSMLMDAKAPIGKGTAPTPKELVGLGLAGCTAMDVAALLKKHKQQPQSFEIAVEIVTSVGKQPAIFESAMLTYRVLGPVDPAVLSEAVMLSQTKYCGVSAMLSKAFPIRYRVELNGAEISSGQAQIVES